VCSDQLAPFLPGPCVARADDGIYHLRENPAGIGRLLAWNGQIGVLYKAYAYIRTLGEDGLREVSENAVLNANYLRARLRGHFDLPYAADGGSDRFCMHEFVLSGDRQADKGVKTLDMAKRLLDYGLHAPTVYFPLIVHEALMVEPTETESLDSLDAFADALISIAREVEEKPHLVTDAPVNTPVLRLDEVRAAKELDVVAPAAEAGADIEEAGKTE
jgi:glycine dehydrogenase subunit 2